MISLLQRLPTRHQARPPLTGTRETRRAIAPVSFWKYSDGPFCRARAATVSHHAYRHAMSDDYDGRDTLSLSLLYHARLTAAPRLI